MNLTPHVASIEEHLSAASAAGDESTSRAAELLLVALEPAARLALMDALAELAGEVSEELGDRTVELRLRAGEVDVVVSPASEALDDPEPEPDEPGESSRITLRLPEELKARAERAAAAQGSSLNTWLVQAVRDGVRAGGPPHRERRQHRVRGWVQG